MEQRPQSHVNRFAAALLAVLWACGCAMGLLATFAMHRPLAIIGAVFALAYAVMWARVAIQGRLLAWSDIAKPWLAR
ncbi:MAG: hypothetical protein ABIQ97_00110, partial [Lysobacteraceae bacterium]